MMKKIAFFMLVFLVLGTGAFAIDKAVGFGGMFAYDSYKGTFNVSGIDWKQNSFSIGILGFFGISKFFEVNLAYLADLSNKGKIGDNSYDNEGQIRLQVGLYFKYPFVITDRIVLFPTIGADFQYLLLNDTSIPSTHYLWPRGGLGLDFFLSRKMFLRGHFLYGWGLPITGDHSHIKYGHGPLIKFGPGWMF